MPLIVIADAVVRPATLNREWGRGLIRVQCNVVGRDVASFVAEARSAIAEQLEIPQGYVLECGRRFENPARRGSRDITLQR